MTIRIAQKQNPYKLESEFHSSNIIKFANLQNKTLITAYKVGMLIRHPSL